MLPSAFIHQLITAPDYEGELVHVERIPASEPVYGTLSHDLVPALVARMRAAGVERLYRHQVRAVDLLLDGKHVMVNSPSASGKSLCYQVPTLHTLVQDADATALFMFPTKALAQDQLRSLRGLACPKLMAASAIDTFDGDTSQETRTTVRKRGRIVLTNPDMLHLGILPHHSLWSRYLHGLRYVVLDEAHVYRGILGSHVANIIRRLRRLCLYYGSTPLFICCSATIANAQEHAGRLCGVEFENIEGVDGPHGEKYFALWNPAIVDKKRGTRRSHNSEASSFLCKLVTRGIRSLVFARTRRLAELIYVYARQRLPAEAAARISPYRAGYLAADRRSIERRFTTGELEGLVATSAMELGVDVGDLDATVLAGYPGNMASAWQQAGRSGRGDNPSLSVLVAQDSPLDQYLMRNPSFFFARRFEKALINPSNPHVLEPHLLCAAWEKPLVSEEVTALSELAPGAVERLMEKGLLRERRGRYYPDASLDYPAQRVNIRSAGAAYQVMDLSRRTLLETVDGAVALSQLHPGAVYLHQGETYVVRDLDMRGRTAWAEPRDVDYYTVARELSDIRVTSVENEKVCGGATVRLGTVQVTTHVVGFRKRRQYTEESLGEEPLDLPETTFATKAFWFDVPPAAVDRVAAQFAGFAGALHACEHAAIGVLPLFALCDRNDIGGVSTLSDTGTGVPHVYIYDAYPGGVGIAEMGYEMVERLWRATLALVRECPCLDGCPSCIQSPKCGNNNDPLDKGGAIALLEALSLPVAQE
jgi:DEAD/DEAH box helicase domain-containing protein